MKTGRNGQDTAPVDSPRSDQGVMTKPPASAGGPRAPGQRWTATRKREVVIRLPTGEPIEAMGRERGVEVYRLEPWRQKALQGIDAALKERGDDPPAAELDAALKRVGELTMETELLRDRCEKRVTVHGSGWLKTGRI